MIHHLVQARHPRRQRLLAILVKEEFGIGQTWPYHALVAANDGAGVGRADVADHQKLVAQFASCIEQWKVFLIGLHGQDQAFLWHRQELRLKCAQQHIRALDQGCHLIEQRLVFNRMQGGACRTGPLGHGGELAHDLGAALGKGRNHRAIARQCGGVAVSVFNHHRRDGGLKAMALRALARAEPEQLDRHHAAAVQRQQAVRRAHKLHAAPAR